MNTSCVHVEIFYVLAVASGREPCFTTEYFHNVSWNMTVKSSSVLTDLWGLNQLQIHTDRKKTKQSNNINFDYIQQV